MREVSEYINTLLKSDQALNDFTSGAIYPGLAPAKTKTPFATTRLERLELVSVDGIYNWMLTVVGFVKDYDEVLDFQEKLDAVIPSDFEPVLASPDVSEDPFEIIIMKYKFLK